MQSLAHLHFWEGLVFHWLFAFDNRLLDPSVPASPTPSLTGTSLWVLADYQLPTLSES